MKTSVLKDGHVFVIHLLNPREISENELKMQTEEEAVVEKAENEKQEKDEGKTCMQLNKRNKKVHLGVIFKFSTHDRNIYTVLHKGEVHGCQDFYKYEALYTSTPFLNNGLKEDYNGKVPVNPM